MKEMRSCPIQAIKKSEIQVSANRRKKQKESSLWRRQHTGIFLLFSSIQSIIVMRFVFYR